jgi:hypothetical protein
MNPASYRLYGHILLQWPDADTYGRMHHRQRAILQRRLPQSLFRQYCLDLGLSRQVPLPHPSKLSPQPHQLTPPSSLAHLQLPSHPDLCLEPYPHQRRRLRPEHRSPDPNGAAGPEWAEPPCLYWDRGRRGSDRAPAHHRSNLCNP